jgi:predicted acetyltransferase
MAHVEVRAASLADRLPIYRMLDLYQYDLSEIWDQDLDCHGEYGYALDRYWDTDGCHAFVVTVEGHYAGFALVDPSVRMGTDGRWMDQFFVLKKYRRRGVGRLMAKWVFAALPGRWEVGQMPQNHAAQVFWRKVIGECTGGRFREHEVRGAGWHGLIQIFESAAAR